MGRLTIGITSMGGWRGHDRIAFQSRDRKGVLRGAGRSKTYDRAGTARMIVAGIDSVTLAVWGILLALFLIIIASLKLYLSGRRKTRLRFFFRVLGQRRLSVL